MDREQFEKMQVKDTITIGDVMPMNRGEMETKMREVYHEMAKALYQVKEEQNLDNCGHYILRGMRKFQG